MRLKSVVKWDSMVTGLMGRVLQNARPNRKEEAGVGVGSRKEGTKEPARVRKGVQQMM